MDQASFTHQCILWDVRKRCQNANLDRHIRLCLGSDPQETVQPEAADVHNSPSVERHAFRKETHSPIVLRSRNHRPSAARERAVSVIREPGR